MRTSGKYARHTKVHILICSFGHSRLVIVAERKTVYEKYPAPLINRLEKHLISLKSELNSSQMRVVSRLEEWVAKFIRCDSGEYVFCRNIATSTSENYFSNDVKPADVFIGYHEDALAALVADTENSRDEKVGLARMQQAL